MTDTKESILSALAKRPIIGDGSYVFTLEKRGYIQAGAWTPEVVVDCPDAVQQLHRDFLRAGADTLQAFTFYASSGRLTDAATGHEYTSDELNNAGCKIVNEVAATRPGTFISGGISPTPSFRDGKGDEVVKEEFRQQVQIFVKRKVDYLLAEFFGDIREAELSIEVMKEANIPVACTMRIGPYGDKEDVSPGECAVRMAKAGADIVGVNCQYDYTTCIKTIKMMKTALDEAGLSPFLMIQPVAYHCPEVEDCKWGYHDLPEFPFCMESRLLTRYDCRKYAREAYEAGARYIGGCCGFEPYHIREMAAELAEERGYMMPGERYYSNFGEKLPLSMFDTMRKRVGREYWENVKPGSGRPFCPSLTEPNNRRSVLNKQSARNGTQ